MDYSGYQRSRDMAWELLNRHKVDRLPVKVSQICKDENIHLLDFQRGSEIIRTLDLQEELRGNDGFSTTIRATPVIFFNPACSVGRQRFTVAHELGHLALRHVGRHRLVCREPAPFDNSIEREANMFAARLLAPACVLWGLGIETAQELAQVCGISLQAAGFRMERLRLLLRRGRFLSSPLERQVYARFYPFIRAHNPKAIAPPQDQAYPTFSG